MAKHGMPGMGGINMNMMRQVQKMQEEMAQAQEELESKEYSTTVGGGAVTAVMSGKKQLLSVKIKPEVADPEDTEMLEDLIISAVNGLLSQIEAESAEKMQGITGGMSIPGLF